MAPSPPLKILKGRREGGPGDSPCLRILKDHRAITSCERFAFVFHQSAWFGPWFGLAWPGLALVWPQFRFAFSISLLGLALGLAWFGPWFGLVWLGLALVWPQFRLAFSIRLLGLALSLAWFGPWFGLV